MSAAVGIIPSSLKLTDNKKERNKKSLYIEKIIQERNDLRDQNSKLWKVIHKQRSIIKELQNCILKEDSSSTSSAITSDNEGGSLDKANAKKNNEEVYSSNSLATKESSPIYSMPFSKAEAKRKFFEIKKKSIDYSIKPISTNVPYKSFSKPLNYNDILNPPELDIILPTQYQNNLSNSTKGINHFIVQPNDLLDVDIIEIKKDENASSFKNLKSQSVKKSLASESVKESNQLNSRCSAEENNIISTNLLMIANSKNEIKDERFNIEAKPIAQSNTAEANDFNFSFCLNKPEQPLVEDEKISAISPIKYSPNTEDTEGRNKIEQTLSKMTDRHSYELETLDNISVRVLTVSTKSNSKGKETFVFRLQVLQSLYKPEPKSSQNAILDNLRVWTIEKNYSQLSKLNSQLKEDGSYSKVMEFKFPGKSCWATTVSFKLDQSKNMLQEFLQLAIESNKTLPNPVSEFLTKGKICEEKDIEKPSSKEGYLMKTDENSTSGTKYYFIIVKDIMEYYTTKNGKLMGEIQLGHAQVKQIPLEKNSQSSNKEFPFIFEILEPNLLTRTIIRHILGAARTGERREWIKAAREPFVSDLGDFETKNEGSTTYLESNRSELSQVSQEAELELLTSETPREPEKIDVTQKKENLNLDENAISKKEKKETGLTNLSKAKSNNLNSLKSNEKDKALKRTLLWGKKKLADFGKVKHIQLPVFGVPLSESVMASKKSESCPLPSIVYRCIEYLDAKEAHLEEGIYRLSGSSATIALLKSKFETEGDYNILKSGIYYDVNAVAGVLKLYLREIPTSVLTEELHDSFDKLSEIPDRRGRIKKAGQLVLSLPLENYTLLRILIGHLIRIVEKSAVNKMPLKNIGIVFSPTLGIPAVLFCLIMADHKYIFSVDANGNPAPQELPEGEEDALLGSLDYKDLETSFSKLPTKSGEKQTPTSNLGNLIPIKKG